ncbi:Flp pilus assembly protein CpaB [Gracilibacillus dipsosauri]|uniref:Flp pilus assembly protein CpaB n=1 Tax=Gracilibacillus dipsosauri TaxID=178340 RepID=UPI00240A11E8
MIEAKRKAFIFLLLAFILAVIAAGLIIQQLQVIAESTGKTIQVAVAGKDINSYEELNSSNVEWIDVPLTDQARNFIQQKSEIKDSISIVDLEEGNYITRNMIRAKSTIPPNERIVQLNVTDNVIVDEPIGEGDKVDIITVYEAEGGTTASLAFEGIPVVQVAGDGADSIIRVSVTIEDAQQLIYYQNIAKQIRVLRLNNNVEVQEVEQSEEGE